MYHLELALSQYGIKEIAGDSDNLLITRYFDEIGFDGAKLKDETSWCSAFVNWVLKKSGMQISGQLNARSWLTIGDKVDHDCQQIGDIVIFWRESKDSWKGHVAFYIADRDGVIYVLGGNQSNKVCIQAYDKNRLLAYRRPKKTEDTSG